jgi:hypothetical protein
VAGGAVAFGDVGRAVRGEPAAGAGEGIRRHAPERSRRGPGANRAAHQGGPKPMRCTRTSSGTPAERTRDTARRRTPGSESPTPPTAPSTPHGGDCSTRTNGQPFERPCDHHRCIGLGSAGPRRDHDRIDRRK